MSDWFKKRWESLLDNLIWVGVVAAVGLVAASAAAFGGRHVMLHVWEIVLVGVLFVAVGVCLFLLFGRVRQLERRTVAGPAEPAQPKLHAELLTEISTFADSLENVVQGTASWEFAEIYHELRDRSIKATNSPGLMNLPRLTGMPNRMANVQIGDLRLYLQRMATLLEQDEARTRQTRVTTATLR